MNAADQGPVIGFLSDPATYGVASVERIETHASVVFLAGDRAYKLKRAIRFSYLDYSTLALREQYCRAELALNRRTAPSLYEAARPVTREANGFAFGGPGAVVDWVVVMRRFDQDTLFDRLAERGALTEPLVLDLAAQIAQFHAEAEVEADSGGLAGMRETVKINADNLTAAPADVFDAADVARLTAATDVALARVAETLESRRRGGRVRWCHGDLHLRNICLVDGRPTLFDCIEFSRLIACIDVLYDLAFLLMDLHGRGLDEAGNAIFNRYLDLCDEGDGLPALPLLLSVRAAVRAHVTAAAARQQPPSGRRVELVGTARRYLALAAALLHPAPPRLIAVGGLSGSGKSVLAYALAPGIGGVPGARVVRSDVVRKQMLEAGLTDRLPPSAYGRETTERVYRRMAEIAAAALAAGHSVIVDAVHADPGERMAIASVARRSGVPFTGLWLDAPQTVLEARVTDRRDDASDADAAVVRRQQRYDLGGVEWQRIDASGAAADVAKRARDLLAGGTGAQPTR